MFSPALIGRGLAVSAVGLFLQNLFQRFNLQKVYMEMIEFNYSQVSSGAERFFHVEGKLHQHEYYDGKFWDKYILAVYRNELLGFQNPEL
jgi:RimJ/RimL family protein N-acetyltransferase